MYQYAKGAPTLSLDLSPASGARAREQTSRQPSPLSPAGQRGRRQMGSVCGACQRRRTRAQPIRRIIGHSPASACARPNLGPLASPQKPPSGRSVYVTGARDEPKSRQAASQAKFSQAKSGLSLGAFIYQIASLIPKLCACQCAKAVCQLAGQPDGRRASERADRMMRPRVYCIYGARAGRSSGRASTRRSGLGFSSGRVIDDCCALSLFRPSSHDQAQAAHVCRLMQGSLLHVQN